MNLILNEISTGRQRRLLMFLELKSGYAALGQKRFSVMRWIPIHSREVCVVKYQIVPQETFIEQMTWSPNEKAIVHTVHA